MDEIGLHTNNYYMRCLLENSIWSYQHPLEQCGGQKAFHKKVFNQAMATFRFIMLEVPHPGHIPLWTTWISTCMHACVRTCMCVCACTPSTSYLTHGKQALYCQATLLLKSPFLNPFRQKRYFFLPLLSTLVHKGTVSIICWIRTQHSRNNCFSHWKCYRVQKHS